MTTGSGAESRIRLQAKKALRKQMRAVRAALPDSACDTRSKEIATRVLALEELEYFTNNLDILGVYPADPRRHAHAPGVS